MLPPGPSGDLAKSQMLLPRGPGGRRGLTKAIVFTQFWVRGILGTVGGGGWAVAAQPRRKSRVCLEWPALGVKCVFVWHSSWVSHVSSCQRGPCTHCSPC